MKKQISTMLAVTLILMLFSFPANADESNITITVDGNVVQFTDAYPFIDENGRTMVPLRAVADTMGVTVEWNEQYQSAIFTRYFYNDERYHFNEEYDDIWLTKAITEFCIGDNESFTNLIYEPERIATPSGSHLHSGSTMMDTVPVVINGRTYAPVRYLAENLGYDVLWDGETQTITIIDELVYNYMYCAGFVSDSTFAVALANSSNISSIEITSVAVRRTSGDTMDFIAGKQCEYTAFTPEQMRENKEFQPLLTQLAEASYTELLGGIQMNLENPDDVYEVIISYNGVKPNGATFTDKCFIFFE